MENDPYKTSWKIKDSDNHGSFPKGEIQKLKEISRTNSYELKWKAGMVDCSFAPLFPDPADPNILRNSKAKGIKGGAVGVYDVTVVISPGTGDLETLSGTSQEAPRAASTPAPLVGQWGAETPPPPGLIPPGRPAAADHDR